MAFFGLFNYSKPVRVSIRMGLKKKRFFLFFELYFRKFWKMIELNLLFLVCCIPIVTIGPAIARNDLCVAELCAGKAHFHGF